MVESLYQNFLKSGKVSSDTRKIEPDAIFFALKGPNFNANALADEALEKGASLVVIDEEKYRKDDRYLLVDDVLKTLQDLAHYHRKQLKIPVIGLTGSNGKTTTKELIHAVLSKKYATISTRGNLNNHIGVPLTLLSITDKHEMAIIEMGANHQGEIAALSAIAEPSHGFITNIGKAHLEGFGGIEGVIKGKSELYHHLIRHDGVVWINSNNPILMNMSKRFKEPLFYPNDGDFYHCRLVGTAPTLTLETETGRMIKTQLIGPYNFENIAVALCIGKYFEVPSEDAATAVEEYNPQNNRSQLVKKEGKTIIMDAYNANPNSMAGALDNLHHSEGTYKWAILGDMKELGEDSRKEHEMIGEKLQSMNLEKIFLLGPEMKAAARACPEALHFEDKTALKEYLKTCDSTNRTILLKGSRSMGLEDCLDVL
jgi:UDP-N-acetylmuramoyl-tripeptide--D-alanyl-D-alanine ligase